MKPRSLYGVIDLEHSLFLDEHIATVERKTSLYQEETHDKLGFIEDSIHTKTEALI